MKVFSELEIFLKSIFYKNWGSDYKLLSFNSNLYQELFYSQEQTEQKNNVKIEYFEFDKNFSSKNGPAVLASQQGVSSSTQSMTKSFSVRHDLCLKKIISNKNFSSI
jgi:hypothetical protein